MVFQSFALMPHLTVEDNVAFGLDLAGEIKNKDRLQKVEAALDRVGLLANAKSYPNELSGGMQQRVGLARALCVDPEVLLMDEAFSALDPLIRTEMQDELIRLQAQDKRTIVFISHDLDEAVRIGDRIAIMQDGEVVQVGTPDDIINNPANDYVRSFFRGVDVSSVLSAKDIAQSPTEPLLEQNSSAEQGMQTLENCEEDYAYVIDNEQHFVGVVSNTSLLHAEQHDLNLKNALLDSPTTIEADASLQTIISQVAKAPCPSPVIDDEGKLIGSISKQALLEALDRDTGGPQ